MNRTRIAFTVISLLVLVVFAASITTIRFAAALTDATSSDATTVHLDRHDDRYGHDHDTLINDTTHKSGRRCIATPASTFPIRRQTVSTSTP